MKFLIFALFAYSSSGFAQNKPWMDLLSGEFFTQTLECIDMQTHEVSERKSNIRFKEVETDGNSRKLSGTMLIDFMNYNFEAQIIQASGSESFTMFLKDSEKQRNLSATFDPQGLSFASGPGQNVAYNIIFSRRQNSDSIFFGFRESRFLPGRGTVAVCQGEMKRQ